MLNITEELICSLALNESAVTNGKSLVRKKAFVKLSIAQDKSIIMGECKGSGASNYITSVDFILPDSPVLRCSCPSRQIPCKHAIGLLVAYQSKNSFTTEEIPQAILAKRSKAEKQQFK